MGFFLRRRLPIAPWERCDRTAILSVVVLVVVPAVREAVAAMARAPMRQPALIISLAVIAAALPARGEDALPEGKGKELVRSACVGCHDIGRITHSGYTRDGWQNVISMMTHVGTRLAPEQIPVVTAYLAENFPERARSAAEVIPGRVEVSIREWTVPTPGSRPHDPLATPDGALWYTGQMANLLGRLDPATGAFKEYPLPTANSGPHGLVADKDGNIWFTANFKGYIGKLDPRTGKVAEYPLGDPEARDPHTLVFDRQGTLWFTVQSANMVGRLSPGSGEVKLVKLPTPRAQPYGMVINSAGVPFFAEFGSNKIASIDPKTLAIREYVLPAAAARPRRIAVTSDDAIWYTDYARGYLGRLDPSTGRVTEFRSPGGREARPYGITVLHDVPWYSESGVSPNTLVRFDPRTHTFQTWPIPSGGGVVRNMMATRDGKLVLACSGVNGVALVDVKE
jgi:virginiamycin B lyase